MGVLLALSIGCSEEKDCVSGSDTGKEDLSLPPAHGLPLLKSELTTHEARELAARGVTVQEFRRHLGVPVFTNRAVRYRLKDGRVTLSTSLQEGDLVPLASIVSERIDSAEQGVEPDA